MKRRDLLRVHPLTPEYREYEFEFSAGKEDRECGFSAFGWEQPNSWFEITDFRVVAK